jgi:hypothetical protein
VPVVARRAAPGPRRAWNRSAAADLRQEIAETVVVDRRRVRLPGTVDPLNATSAAIGERADA